MVEKGLDPTAADMIGEYVNMNGMEVYYCKYIYRNMYEFLRDVSFAVFAGNLLSMKIKSLNFFKQSQCIWSPRVDSK